jgi:hypothetical protein
MSDTSHEQENQKQPSNPVNRLKVVFFLSVCYLASAVIIVLITGSLSLLSEAGHMPAALLPSVCKAYKITLKRALLICQSVCIRPSQPNPPPAPHLCLFERRLRSDPLCIFEIVPSSPGFGKLCNTLMNLSALTHLDLIRRRNESEMT